MSELMLINPRKRRKTTKKKVVKRRSPVRRVAKRAVSKRRRNPIRRKAGIMGIVQSTVMPAATAAAGAIGLDVVWGMAPIPENLKTGPMRHVVKAAGAIGLGMIAEMVVKKSTASQFATGALTVVMHQAMREGMTRFAPNIQLGEYVDEGGEMGYYGAGVNAGDSMGMYLDQPAAPTETVGSYDPMGAYDDLTL